MSCLKRAFNLLVNKCSNFKVSMLQAAFLHRAGRSHSKCTRMLFALKGDRKTVPFGIRWYFILYGNGPQQDLLRRQIHLGTASGYVGMVPGAFFDAQGLSLFVLDRFHLQPVPSKRSPLVSVVVQPFSNRKHSALIQNIIIYTEFLSVHLKHRFNIILSGISKNRGVFIPGIINFKVLTL